MNNKRTRIYNDENGNIRKFDFDKFRSSITSNRRIKHMKLEEYEMELASSLSCSFDTIDGWRKGKNAPRDIETVFALEEKMGLSKNSLLYSENEHLKNELNKYKLKLEQAEKMLSDLTKQYNDNHKNFAFIRCFEPFCLRYEGFSNLIDIIIGMYCGREEDVEGPSTYAEELSYILSDYTNSTTLEKILGFNGQRTEEEIKEYLDNNKGKNDDEFFKWLNRGIVNSNGEHLYDENFVPQIHGLQMWEKIVESPVLEPEDKEKIKALLNELINRWDDYELTYATCSITIMFGELELKKYRLGLGCLKPTYENRMDVITELLFLTGGNIEQYALENAIVFRNDQFEMEMEIVFDLSKL